MNVVARALIALAIVACSREAGPRESTASNTLAPSGNPVAPASAAPSAAAPSEAPPALPPPAPGPVHVVKTTLVKSPVQIELPGGWALAPAQSDESTGLVAFVPDPGSAEPATAFLDGSLVARVPRSVDDAKTTALQQDDCARPGACSVLGAEVANGFLVSLRRPHAIEVVSWHEVGPQQAVRCGFEMSALHAPSVNGRTWLDDAASVARARAEGEAICRSVKAAH